MECLQAEKFQSQLCGEGFEICQSAAGGNASFFHKRRIQNEGTAIDKRMIRDFEGFAFTLRGSRARKNILVHSQVGLKPKCVAGIPPLLTSERAEEFLAKDKCVFSFHGFKLRTFSYDASTTHEVENSRGTSEQRLALEQGEQVPVKRGVNLQAVTAVLDNVGIDKTRYQTLTEERFA